jgi:rhamnosyltransferase
MQFPERSSTAAGVVAFKPDINVIVPLVRSIIKDVSYVLVFVNAVIDDAIVLELNRLGFRCQIIKSDHNVGVAEALNIIALHAILHECARVVLFDQDSQPPEGMIPALGVAMDRVIQAGNKPAVVGPAIVSPRGRSGEFKSPRYFVKRDTKPVDPVIPVQYVITSGTLLDLSAFRAVGKFRSDFFIDAIDTEWCFRAWSKGYSCWFVADLPMEHTIGEGSVTSKLFGVRFPHQSKMRIYSYFRNQTASLMMPHVPFAWKARFGVHMTRLALMMLLNSRFSSSQFRLIGGAVWDGLRKRLGPPAGAGHTLPAPRCRDEQ